MQTPWVRWLAMGAVMLAGAAAVAVYAYDQQKAAGRAASDVRPPVPVVVQSVLASHVPIYIIGIGTIAAFNTDIVRSQVQGQLESINFVEGQMVKSGDLLGRIDPRPFQAQVDQAVANRERDQALLDDARIIFTRDQQLLAKGFATQQVYDTQKATVEQLEGTVKADEAQIEAARTQLSFTSLTSPISGITGIRQIDVGNIIHPTDQNGLVVVTQVEPISLIFTLPEMDLGRVQQEMAKAPLKVLAFTQDDRIKLGEGILKLVDNEIVQATGSIELKAEFANRDRRLWPGQLVNVRLLIETRPDGLTIPASAVQQGPGGPYVFVVGPDEKARMRTIATGQIMQGVALIDSGLSAGEKVVVAGQYRLAEGSVVNELHGKAAQQVDQQNAVQQAIP